MTIQRSLYFLALLVSIRTQGNIKLPAIFSDGMVLQQRSSVLVWGQADPGENISLQAGWSSKTMRTRADGQGKWAIKLKTPAAGGPYTIQLSGNNQVSIKDVLLGEVWLCSGQSNMVFSLKSSEGAKAEIAQANHPAIRYFSVKRQYGLQQFDDAPGSAWVPTTPATAGSFSAVAYYFAKKIQATMNVPVGIVYAAWGGTPAEAWTPRGILESDTVLHRYIHRWNNIQQRVGKDSAAYHIKLAQWENSRQGKKPQEPQTLYYFKRPWREPSVLFNGMIDPVVPYAIKGVLWYQGESNVAYAGEYAQLFGAMISSWRDAWKQALPFYFVQIASFGYGDLDAAARLREAQHEVMNKLPRTGMAVTTDLGDMKDVHFTRKKEVGERLALIALHKDYGKRTTAFSGPLLRKAVKENNRAVITFSGAALHATGDTLRGFEIGYRQAGNGQVLFKKAQAKIEGDRVIVWEETVQDPVAVRYAWLLAGEANLFGGHELPAFPFRATLQ